MKTYSNIDKANLAGVHLNLSSVLSTASQHQKALNHAQQALTIAKTCGIMDKNLAITAVVAHQSLGKEFWYLGMQEDAAKEYKTG